MNDTQEMLTDCEHRESKLSDWERNFIESMAERFAQYSSLTSAQYSKLSEIWERVTA